MHIYIYIYIYVYIYIYIYITVDLMCVEGRRRSQRANTYDVTLVSATNSCLQHTEACPSRGANVLKTARAAPRFISPP